MRRRSGRSSAASSSNRLFEGAVGVQRQARAVLQVLFSSCVFSTSAERSVVMNPRTPFILGVAFVLGCLILATVLGPTTIAQQPAVPQLSPGRYQAIPLDKASF